jgi:hypothetical protein
MPITGAGWEFHVQRLGIHKSGTKTRTYGEYQVFLNGNAVAALSGNVCESPGPGENQTPASFENPRRLEQGRYPLSTQFGPHFVTIGYTTQQPENHPFPGVALTGTGNRSAILIHPAHAPPPPWSLFLSSIGCLNLTKPLQPDGLMDFMESRSRVIDVISSLAAFAPGAFAQRNDTLIPNAAVVIDGEPMNMLPSAAAPVA